MGGLGVFGTSGWSSSGGERAITSSWRGPFSAGSPGDLKNARGSGFGAVVEVDLKPGWRLVFQPGTVGKGCEWSSEYRSSLSTFDAASRSFRNYPYTEHTGWEHKLRYFQLPVLLKYVFTTRRASPYALAGPSIAFVTTARLTTRRRIETDAPPQVVAARFGANASAEQSQDTRTRFVGVETGLVFGVGARARVGAGELFVEGIYDWVLTNIDKAAQGYSVKSSGYQVKAGVSFAISRR